METDVLELDGVRDPALDVQGLALGDDLLFFVKKNEQVIDKQRSFVDRRRVVDQVADLGRDLVQRPGIERVVADHEVALEHAPRDEAVADAVDDRRHDRDTDVPDPLVDDQAAKTGEVAFEHRLVGVDERARQVVEPDLLDEVLVHQNVGIVVHFAAVARTEAHIRPVLAPVDEVDDRGGEGNDEDRRGGEWEIGGQDDQIADEADDRTDHRKEVRDDLDRSVPRLAVGVLELFVELGHIEGGVVDLRRLGHDQRLDVPHDQLARDPGGGGADPSDHVVQDAVGEQEDQKEHHRRSHKGVRPLGKPFGGAGRRIGGLLRDDLLQFVQDLFREQGADDRHHALEQSDEGFDEQNPRSRLPHQGENVPEPREKAPDQFAKEPGQICDILRGRNARDVVAPHRGRHHRNHRSVILLTDQLFVASATIIARRRGEVKRIFLSIIAERGRGVKNNAPRLTPGRNSRRARAAIHDAERQFTRTQFAIHQKGRPRRGARFSDPSDQSVTIVTDADRILLFGSRIIISNVLLSPGSSQSESTA